MARDKGNSPVRSQSSIQATQSSSTSTHARKKHKTKADNPLVVPQYIAPTPSMKHVKKVKKPNQKQNQSVEDIEFEQTKRRRLDRLKQIRIDNRMRQKANKRKKQERMERENQSKAKGSIPRTEELVYWQRVIADLIDRTNENLKIMKAFSISASDLDQNNGRSRLISLETNQLRQLCMKDDKPIQVYGNVYEPMNPEALLSPDAIRQYRETLSNKISSKSISELKSKVFGAANSFPVLKHMENMPSKSGKLFSVPWLPVGSGPVTISEDLAYFADYVSLTDSEIKLRQHIVDVLTLEIQSRWGNKYFVRRFGSAAVGLETFLSDIDISIMANKDGEGIEEDIATDVDPIGQASAIMSNEDPIDDDEDIFDIIVDSFPSNRKDSMTEDGPNTLPKQDNAMSSKDSSPFGVISSDSTHNMSSTKTIEQIPSKSVNRNGMTMENVHRESSTQDCIPEVQETHQKPIDCDNRTASSKDRPVDTSQTNNDDIIVTNPLKRPFAAISPASDDELDIIPEDVGTDFTFNVPEKDLGNADLNSMDNIDLDGIQQVMKEESKRRFSWEFHDNRRQRVERLLQSQAEAGTTRDRRNEDEVTANPVGSDSLSRGQVFSLLSKLHRLIANRLWVKSSEFRGKATVPIINIVHKCSLEIDISVGVKSEDTTDIVKYLQSYCEGFVTGSKSATQTSSGGNASPKHGVFYQLAAFLKILLAIHHLDMPFTGGIGSYKIYIMIANIFRLVQKRNSSQQRTAGDYLLEFFDYYGSQTFTTNTVIRIPGPSSHDSGSSLPIEATFRHCAARMQSIRELFRLCHTKLSESVDKRSSFPLNILINAEILSKRRLNAHLRSLLYLETMTKVSATRLETSKASNISAVSTIPSDIDEDSVLKRIVQQINTQCWFSRIMSFPSFVIAFEKFFGSPASSSSSSSAAAAGTLTEGPSEPPDAGAAQATGSGLGSDPSAADDAKTVDRNTSDDGLYWTDGVNMSENQVQEKDDPENEIQDKENHPKKIKKPKRVFAGLKSEHEYLYQSLLSIAKAHLPEEILFGDVFSILKKYQATASQLPDVRSISEDRVTHPVPWLRIREGSNCEIQSKDANTNQKDESHKNKQKKQRKEGYHRDDALSGVVGADIREFESREHRKHLKSINSDQTNGSSNNSEAANDVEEDDESSDSSDVLPFLKKWASSHKHLHQSSTSSNGGSRDHSNTTFMRKKRSRDAWVDDFSDNSEDSDYNPTKISDISSQRKKNKRLNISKIKILSNKIKANKAKKANRGKR